ncbi:MAG TPA: cytochrome P450 [Reyranella sp.]|nr:cytochrome P450 [Reyranella sp.]
MNEMTPPSLADGPLVFDPLSPAFIADPYRFYRRLREEAPVFRTPQGLWLLSRYDDVAFSLRDRRFGKDFAGNITRRYGDNRMDEPVFANLARTMLVLDPPDHTRLRSLVTKAFTARRVADMRPRIAKLVDEQLDRVAGQGAMDVIRDLAHRLPVIVICDMLGIPEDHRAAFLMGSNVSGRILDPAPMTREELDRANMATTMSNAYFDQLCDLRRREPRDDLTTEMVQAEEAGDRLTTEELHANIGLLFGAGHETTTNLIGNGLLALHRSPDQWQRLKDDPALIPGAVDELLRYDSSVQMTGRVTTTEVEVGGVTLPANESVIMLLGAANRDPAHYADPETLDVGRQNIRPMSFGGGIHHCLGAQLARLEAELVFTALVERLPDLELPEKDAPDWRGTFTLRGLHKLPAIWH